MNSNKLFNDCQFGFRSKRNCILQLLDVFDDWVKAYDEGYQVDTIYLDFKKAFDSVLVQSSWVMRVQVSCSVPGSSFDLLT